MKKLLFLLCMIMGLGACAANPITGLLERIDPGASKKFIIQLKPSDTDYFELDQKGNKVVVRGNSYVNIATGINWYLKYYANTHLSWNGMKASLPEVLPPVTKPERHETKLKHRYDLNYCTFSYTMPFWDWDRWEQEIDWMALHGVTMPLAAVGQECVWRNVLLRLGYTPEEIGEFIAGPAFLAWWEMNNLEGWGGPNPESWYARQEDLQHKIVARMREYGISPVFPGYSGMMPNNADEKLGLNVTKSERSWNGYQRPSFLNPNDSRFAEIAEIYYDELEKLFGKTKYYSMDPFHEADTPEGYDFDAAGKALLAAMHKASPGSVWLIQGWSGNPREEMIKNLPKGEIIIIDLFSDGRPMWEPLPLGHRQHGYLHHEWIFSMIENFGGNIGLHGRMDQMLNNFYQMPENPLCDNVVGLGFTMEGSENNPVMFELASELPWRAEKFTKEDWLKGYVTARYGSYDPDIAKAWEILANSIYNCPRGNIQQGTTESIFCCRPNLNNFQASSWSKMKHYYDPASTRAAAELMLKAADRMRGNNNYEYDLIDIMRQAVADHARQVYQHTIADYKSFSHEGFKHNSEKFLDMLLAQDELLSARPEFMVGRWIEYAKKAGNNDEEKALYEWNARTQITTWGNRECADAGKLRDYAHKEWNGILRDFYYPRWQAFFATLEGELGGADPVTIDYYAMEEPWTLARNPYPSTAQADPIDKAKEVYARVFEK